MWRDAALVAGKDLRIERRSRVAVNQIAPFAILVLVLFAFALDADRTTLERAAAGLFWVGVLFSALLAVQRSFAIEAVDGGRDGLRLSGLDPAGIFVGKAAAVIVQLLALELLMGAAIAVLYRSEVDDVVVLVATAALATVGIGAAGTIYGVVAAGLRVKETLLPLLLLPVLAPVLLAATRSWETALGVTAGNPSPWLRVLGAFTAVYAAFGILAFGPLLEES